MKVVLDAWAVVALLKAEPAAERVRAVIDAREPYVCSVNLGEAYYTLIRSHGPRIAEARIGGIRQLMQVDDPDWPLVRDAAELKGGGGLSFADAFCVATARRHAAPLYTGDDEIIGLDDTDVEIVDLRAAA